MLRCPHCNQPIQVVEGGTKVSWWKYDSGGPTVSLGCGTLILIAIIVSMFSRSGTEALQQDIRQLDQRIEQLETSIQELREVLPAVPAEKSP